jgi:hypothetical protein
MRYPLQAALLQAPASTGGFFARKRLSPSERCTCRFSLNFPANAFACVTFDTLHYDANRTDRTCDKSQQQPASPMQPAWVVPLDLAPPWLSGMHKDELIGRCIRIIASPQTPQLSPPEACFRPIERLSSPSGHVFVFKYVLS